MKRVLILAAIFAVISLALLLAEAFLRRPPVGISPQKATTEQPQLDENSILID